jgi:hypothetical protein
MNMDSMNMGYLNMGHLSEKSHWNEISVRASLLLLGELEASLQSSQKALLARDLAGVERETSEQRRLHQGLEDLGGAPVFHPQSAAEWRAAAIRILHLGRVQLALLARTRRSLHVFSHLAQGPDASYAPLAHAGKIWPVNHGV